MGREVGGRSKREGIYVYLWLISLVVQTVKVSAYSAVRPSSLGLEDPWVWKIPWRREWQPTPVLLPGKSHGQRSLIGYSPWGCKESDTTEQLAFTFLL